MYRHLLALLLIVLSADVFSNGCSSPVTYGPFAYDNYTRCMDRTVPSNKVLSCTPVGDVYGRSVTGYLCNSCPDGQVCKDSAGNPNCASDYYYDANTNQCLSGEEPEPEPNECEEFEGEEHWITWEGCGSVSCVNDCAVTVNPNLSRGWKNGVCIDTTARVTFTGSECTDYGDGGNGNLPEDTYVPIQESDPVEDSDCTPNSPDYSGTGVNGDHYCNANSVCEAPAVPFYFPDGSFTCLSLEPCSNPDMVRVNGDCQYPPNYETVETTEAVVIGEDGTKTTTTTTTTTKTDSSANTTTTTETTVIQETPVDPNDPDAGYNDPEIIIEGTETGDQGKGKSLVRGGHDCNEKPTCVNADAVACATLQQVWMIRCKDENYDLTDFSDAELAAAQSDADALDAQLSGLVSSISGEAGEFDTVLDFSDFSIDYTPEYGSCPSDIPLDLGDFGTIALPLSTYCTEMALFATVIRFMAALIAFWMVFNTLREL